MPLSWALILLPLLIAMNAFFVAAEYAVVALRPPHVEELRKRGRRRTAAAMERLKGDPASAIGTIQVCITMTNLLLGWIGEPAMSAALLWLFSPLAALAPGVMSGVSIILAFIIVTLLTVVLSELLPKALTLQYVTPAASLTAVPVAWIQRALYPLVWLMNAMANAVIRPLGLGTVEDLEEERVTPQELRLLAARAGQQGTLTAREQSLVLNSLSIARRRARDIMVPRMRISHLDVRWSMDENREAINQYLYTRMPLCDGGIDHVVGVVLTKEFLTAYYAEGDAKVLLLIARPAVYAPENVTVDRLLEVFHVNHTQMVFLVDEHGSLEGLVTLQDVMDELVGEIDEARAALSGPAEAKTEPTGDGERFEVDGETPVHEIAKRLGREDWGTSESASTIGGLIVARLGRVPRAGEHVRVDGVGLRAVQCTARRVERVGVER